ncbi:transposase [Kitasatospora sp. NPDC002040]|uniref:transposase n=1 Tax=Kitasatospora sp. NPDC002040 TaxID=3154661 RepID=UPI00331C0A5C
MSRQRIAVGDWIAFEDERHQVAGLDGQTIRLRSEVGRVQTVLVNLVLTDPTFRQASAPLLPVGGATGDVDPTGVLASLPDHVRAEALALEEHIREVNSGYRSGDPLRSAPGEPRREYHPDLPRTARTQAKAAELGVTPRRIEQYQKQYRDAGLWGLVDRRKARVPNPVGNLDPRVVQAILDQAAAERNDSSATIGGRFYRRVTNRLDAEHGTSTVAMPSKDVFRRAVDHLVRHSPAGPAYRRQSAGNQPDRTFGHVLATRPGEVVMLDTTPLDVLAYDPETATTMRIELTIALDVATRSILAWRITPEATKAIDIGLLIADVMTPEPMRPAWKDALRYQMLRVPYDRRLSLDERLAEAAARPVVYPETILYDHGKPYISVIVQRACTRWRINLQDARKLKPTDKPQVERLFGSIRTQFSEHVAGYKGPNVASRGSTVENQARWTIDEITEFFAEYVIAVYQRQHHRGLNLSGFPDLRVSPNEAYRMALGSAGFVDCPQDPNLYYELLPIAPRTIQPYGVQIGYLIYDAEILYQYRGTKAPYPDGHWPIRYDPRNLLHSYFLDPADGRWHTLRWIHALAEHQPFTDITLRVAKQQVEQRGGSPAEQTEVAAALVELQNRTDAPETWRTDRKRLVRDSQRAAEQQRDESRSQPAVRTPPQLSIIPRARTDQQPETDSTLGIDLSGLEPAEIWSPYGEQA